MDYSENLWYVCRGLIAANPERNPEKLQIGDEVKLLVPKSMVTVATTEEVNYTEKVNYEVKVEHDKNMYKTEKKVKVKGSEGEKEVLAKVIKHNGVVVEEEILEEKVLKSLLMS